MRHKMAYEMQQAEIEGIERKKKFRMKSLNCVVAWYLVITWVLLFTLVGVYVSFAYDEIYDNKQEY